MSHEPCKLRTIALRRDSGRFLEEPQKAYDYFRSALRERQVTIPELFWAQDEQMYHGRCGHWGQVFIDACTCTRMMLLILCVCLFAPCLTSEKHGLLDMLGMIQESEMLYATLFTFPRSGSPTRRSCALQKGGIHRNLFRSWASNRGRWNWDRLVLRFHQNNNLV